MITKVVETKNTFFLTFHNEQRLALKRLQCVFGVTIWKSSKMFEPIKKKS